VVDGMRCMSLASSGVVFLLLPLAVSTHARFIGLLWMAKTYLYGSADSPGRSRFCDYPRRTIVIPRGLLTLLESVQDFPRILWRTCPLTRAAGRGQIRYCSHIQKEPRHEAAHFHFHIRGLPRKHPRDSKGRCSGGQRGHSEVRLYGKNQGASSVQRTVGQGVRPHGDRHGRISSPPGPRDPGALQRAGRHRQNEQTTRRLSATGRSAGGLLDPGPRLREGPGRRGGARQKTHRGRGSEC
jgi:hypothetical protein